MDKVAELRTKGYYIAILNGEKCKTEEQFHTEIAKAFRFPDNYGKNLDALKDRINDLSWLEEQSYALIIFNEHSFLANAPKGKKAVLDVFDNATEQWEAKPDRDFMVLGG